MRILFLILIVSFFSQIGFCQSDEGWDEKGYYALDFPDVLDYFEKIHQKTIEADKLKKEYLTGKYRFCITYLGETRKISTQRVQLIKQVFKQYNIVPDNLFEQYEMEIAFSSKEKTYWIPVQKIVFPHFAKELNKGDKVYLTGVFFGYWEKGKELDWVFMDSDFLSGRCR